MNRRTLLIALACAFAPLSAAAGDFVDYRPGVIKTALEEGKTVFVDYGAKWCSTCKSQERTINALRDANPAYDASMMFVKVDWDSYKTHYVTARHNIPRRSTLIVLRGDEELGRIVAGTSRSQIQQLMDLGLGSS